MLRSQTAGRQLSNQCSALCCRNIIVDNALAVTFTPGKLHLQCGLRTEQRHFKLQSFTIPMGSSNTATFQTLHSVVLSLWTLNSIA